MKCLSKFASCNCFDQVIIQIYKRIDLCCINRRLIFLELVEHTVYCSLFRYIVHRFENIILVIVFARFKIHICKIEYLLWLFVAIIGQVAPALGLLGTIIGFIKTVMAANSQELVSRADLLNGSMEALVSAALGLVVAIPVTVMYGSLRVRLDRTIVELEAAASRIVGYLSALKEKTR